MSFVSRIKQALSGGEETTDLDFEPKEDTTFNLSDEKDIKITTNIEKLADVDVKYPLIKPFAYAHVKWDEENKEVVYHVEEPELSDEDEEKLEQIKENLSEKLDVSLSAMQDRGKVVAYLEKKIDELLVELGLQLSDEQHDKIMYYIYRDFVGLGRIEPFMHDPYIEDLGADGTGIPIFAVHSEFGSVKSDIAYEDEEDLKNLVVKLAERCGKYVSYANPLLDGALPDGSRVNATLTEDVTSRGPTFSIRKFQETPFSAVDMMDLGTSSPKIMAYMWLLMQYQQSVLISGGTATGKTSFLNSTVSFIPPEDKIVSIEDSVTGDTEIEVEVNGRKTKKPIREIVDPVLEEKGFEMEDGTEKAFLDKSPFSVATIDENLETSYRKPTAVYRHEVGKDIYRVKTSTGKEVKVTGDHSLFTLQNGELAETKPGKLDEDSFIATPRKLSPGNGVRYVDVLQTAEDRTRIFGEGEEVEKVFEKVERCELETDISESGFKYWKRNGMMRGQELVQVRKNSDIELSGTTVRSKSRNTEFPLYLELRPELLEMMGLWLGDGSYDRYNQNAVLVTTNEQEIGIKIEEAAEILGVNISKKSDGTYSLNSVMLYEVMRGLGFKGKSATKRIPEFCLNLDNEQLGKLLKGYFSADGSVKKDEVSCCSQSRKLLEGVQDLLLRLGIVSSINDYHREDDCKELSISSKKFLEKYRDRIGFIQEQKEAKLEEILDRQAAHHEKADVIPTDEGLAEKVHAEQKIQWNYRNGVNNLGRNYLQQISDDTDNTEIYRIANSEIFWDSVVEIEKLETGKKYVYDISVEGPERFLGNNILLHNTRELQLPHENWIPSVTRTMFGTSNNSDVDMNQLLKESFRENPDYVIVGEVRGEEASVLFQGMSSGHPSLGTMHASGPNDVVKRLVTPPISLSSALVESLDVIVQMTHAKGVEKSARRVKAVHEVQKVMGDSESARTNEAFSWTARDDSHKMKGEPFLFDQISSDYGVSKDKLEEELENRAKVLEWLQEKGVKDFQKVSKVISEYYKNREEILKMANSEAGEYSLEDVIEAEKKVDITRPEQLDQAMEAEQGGEEELESEIRDLDGTQPLENKLESEENPVRELEKKLRDESRKVDSIRGTDREENPFDEKEKLDSDPFEA